MASRICIAGLICRQGLATVIASLMLAGCGGTPDGPDHDATVTKAGSSTASDALLDDSNSGDDWAGFGRTYGEQHFSPLNQLNTRNIGKLGLAWSIDLPPGNSVSGPLKVADTLYFTTGYSIVHAVDARTGKEKWVFDPKAPEAAGKRLRMVWGSRGLGWWDGKIYTGTVDGRLIAIDAQSGKQVWEVQTLMAGDDRFISGPPRTFAGKVIIGHGGADGGATRGYVTAYDAQTGKQLWRFYTVPGNPANGFEDKAQEMAAKTWTGEWWKHGGGGTAWNAFTFDPETNTMFVGTGNGAPWNQHIRSPGGGDNLFLSSIVALDATTGAYKWHYQTNPGETWDYNATMDMQLAELPIDGKQRKVVMQAPKNGFFYVLDRLTGKLISAEKIAKVTWATKIDIATGRPVEVPAARYVDGQPFEVWPGNMGAHSWMPMAYSNSSKLVYIPVRETASSIGDVGIDRKNWQFKPGNQPNLAVALGLKPITDPRQNTSFLLAWDPVRQRQVWKIPTPGSWNGGILATAGGLIFQGQADGKFNVYADRDGKLIWSFNAQAPILAPPITYRVRGQQYVTVLTGAGTAAGANAAEIPFAIDYYSQARRVLTFAIGGKLTLPKSEPFKLKAADDPGYRPDPASAQRGIMVFNRCLTCHGVGVVASGTAPDLRGSAIPTNADSFAQIVRGGALVSQGMPQFDLNDQDLKDVREYIRSEADKLRRSKK